MAHNVDHEDNLDLFNKDNVALTANSVGTEIGQYVLRGSKRMVFVWGDYFGGGTVTIELSPDDGVTWFTTGITATSKSMNNIDYGWVHNSIKMRAQLSGAGDTTVTLTGTIDPAASTSVVGVGTLFLTELSVGQSIIVSGETRVIDTITDNTNLTVTSAFTDNANDTTPDKLEPPSVRAEMR